MEKSFDSDAALLPQEWFARSATVVARELVGAILLRKFDDGRQIRFRIVETEAYLQSCPASHSFKGKTPRNEQMFGPPGFAYVYFIYGMYFCLNVVTGEPGVGEAVLLRALEVPQENSHHTRDAAGPGKLCRLLRSRASIMGFVFFLQIRHCKYGAAPTQSLGCKRPLV